MFTPCVSMFIYETTVDTIIAISCASGIPRTGRSDLCGPDRSSNIHFIRTLRGLENGKRRRCMGGDAMLLAHTVLCVPIRYNIVYTSTVAVRYLAAQSKGHFPTRARGRSPLAPSGWPLCASVSSSAWPRHCYFTVRSLSPRLHHRPQTYTTISCPCYYCHYRPIICYHII